MLHLKRTALFKKKSKNQNSFVMSSESPLKRKLEILSMPVLENHRITNSCVVVTRYFGGIKLGAGGLIRAYAGSVAQAVREIGLVEIKEQVVLGITLSYSQYQEFANFLKDHQLAEQDPMFTDQVMTTIFVDKENTSSITAALVEFYNGKVIIEDQGIREVEVPLFSVEK